MPVNLFKQKLKKIPERSGGWKSFSYDTRGNMTKGDGLTSATYNAMDKPTQIKKDGKTLNFTYGPEHMRFKQVNGSVTTFFSDKLYEEEITGSKTTWRAYIDDIAVISQTTGEGATIRYTHRDRLGSARVFTDHNGQVEAERNFDPFGKPRLASGGLKAYGNSKLDDLDKAKTRRGFTDHEHLDDVELIHMNGRVYDYNLGRFMSVDPVIQAPGNSQSINPYSYIMNNPLAGTDPSGYESEPLEIVITCSANNPCGDSGQSNPQDSSATGDSSRDGNSDNPNSPISNERSKSASSNGSQQKQGSTSNNRSNSSIMDIGSQGSIGKTRSERSNNDSLFPNIPSDGNTPLSNNVSGFEDRNIPEELLNGTNYFAGVAGSVSDFSGLVAPYSPYWVAATKTKGFQFYKTNHWKGNGSHNFK
ncbi:RHS repeat domain-containing protein [Pseudoalteromonas sp. SaAl2]